MGGLSPVEEIALQTSHQEGPVYLRLTDFCSAMGLKKSCMSYFVAYVGASLLARDG
jgi:hypothetical protein